MTLRLAPIPDRTPAKLTLALDPDIHAVHWLDYEAILSRSDRMRSPLALAVIERHRQGVCYPLDLIHIK